MVRAEAVGCVRWLITPFFMLKPLVQIIKARSSFNKYIRVLNRFINELSVFLTLIFLLPLTYYLYIPIRRVSSSNIPIFLLFLFICKSFLSSTVLIFF